MTTSSQENGLTEWMKEHLTRLYHASTSTTTQSPEHSEHSEHTSTSTSTTLDEAFSTTFAPNATVILNNQKVDLELLKESYEGLKSATSVVEVGWGDVRVESPRSGSGGGSGGENKEGGGGGGAVVVGEYTLTRQLRFRVRAGPAKAVTRVKFRAEIKPTSSNNSNNADTDTVNTDTRRIVHLVRDTEEIPVRYNLHPNPNVNAGVGGRVGPGPGADADAKEDGEVDEGED